MNITKASFERIYREEQDVKVKERMLLVLNVVYHAMVAAHVIRYLHRNRSWASVWLKRYDEEGIEGLKDKVKTGRPPKLSEKITYRIKITLLKENNQGWTTKQVEQLITEESGIKYHCNHIYRILRKWGFRQKVPRKVHLNTASRDEKDDFKKRFPRYLWMSNTKRKVLP